MLFNSYIFVFLFFPVCLLGFYFLQKKSALLAKVWLIGFSMWFYGYFNISYLCIMLFSILCNYGFYLWMSRTKQYRGRILALGVTLNLGVLFYFKYFDFFLENINTVLKASLPLQHILLPLGISFFTFQQISFLADTYRGELSECNFTDYALFVSFFPQLIAGPIVTHDEMLPQFQKIGKKKWDEEQFTRGLFVFILGMAKKVLIADTFGTSVDTGYSMITALSSMDAILVMLFYTLQLYFDFSGYCDMAIGIGHMLGITIPVNFNSPYKACNIIDFWKRWHITLSRFFTKNIYIPLGGNRKGAVRMYGNLFFIFFLSGLWHGAGWTFILWGVMHGVLYCITRAVQIAKKKKQSNEQENSTKNQSNIEQDNSTKNQIVDRSNSSVAKKVGHVVGVLLTFIYVNVAWVFFRAESIREAVSLLGRIFTGGMAKPSEKIAKAFNLDEFWYVLKVLHLTDFTFSREILMVVFTVIILIAVFFGKNAQEFAKKFKMNIGSAMIAAFLFIWCIVSLSGVSTFLYFNF